MIHFSEEDSLCDTVWDLHMLSGDELREILERVNELELLAELGAEQEDRNDEEENVTVGRVMKRNRTDLMKGLMMVMRALMYQVG